ncbi:MAG: multicopper oxidase family protein [Gammaproteobacteria bacterium]|nr:MAG: multicopper oxidase family protein [Gammaproteobacteria bacterium]
MNIKRDIERIRRRLAVTLMLLGMIASPAGVWARIQGVTGVQGPKGPVFHLTAGSFHITTPDGHSLLMWGYGIAGSKTQYPGPTLIVNEGDQVTVTLTNQGLPMPVSILFPGQHRVVATGGSTGQITRESTGPNDTVTYTFVASHPGTYTYYSGTRPGLQVEMGLVGALIVRPKAGADHAYNDPATRFDREYLLLLTEVDQAVHTQVELGHLDQINNTLTHSTLWFINGRNGPDTLYDDNVGWMPHQPYGALVRMHPGEKVLMRVIGGGRELHPFHTHGNNFTLIARDGRELSSGPGQGIDLAVSDYTLQVQPGATYDAIFEWTGEKLGWDIYGTTAGGRPHTCVDNDGDGFDETTHEYCPDHEKPIPVILPENQQLTFGPFYSGSPFLGVLGNLPPGEGGMNLYGGMYFMWHSHSERELTNDNIYPGGMLTMLIVEHPSVPIP